jgi:hypothetical protein
MHDAIINRLVNQLLKIMERKPFVDAIEEDAA